MGLIFAGINNKGGTGKTTLTVNMADLIARANPHIPVCIIDLDPQGHAAVFLGLGERTNGRCIGNVLKDPGKLRDNIMNASRVEDRLERKNLFVLPASRELDASLEELAALAIVGARRGKGPNLSTVLSDTLGDALNKFYVFIDCPPNLGMLTTAVYNFADFALVPVSTRFLDFRGAQEHTEQLARLRRDVAGTKTTLKIVVPSQYDQRRMQDRRILEEVIAVYGQKTVSDPVPVRVEVQEAPENGMTLFEYAQATGKTSQALAVYAKIAKRILN